MGKEYTISHVQKRDEWTSKFGPMQDYAITVEGEANGWIKLTQKPETAPPRQGDTIFGSITTAKTSNGTSYLKFKKENPSYPSDSPSSGAPTNIPDQRLDYIVLMLEELTGRKSPLRDSEPVVLEEDPFEGMGI